MQYETIILELLSRIKKLEDDVNELKQFQNNLSSFPNNDDKNLEGSEYQIMNNATVSYKKMTDEMIDICYKCGKKVSAGESVQELADDIAESTGMNRNSAIMYLYAVQGMLDGTIYMKKYYDNIFNVYGSDGLKRAIRATRLHIDYRRECGQNVDSIEDICNAYEKRL